ncbi:MAG: hypothetical protein AAF389_03260 [Gemmatimonadota bacterium]
MLRNIGAFVAGVVTLGLIVMTLQQISAALHPLPAGLDPLDPNNAEAFAAHLEGMPTTAWLVAMLSEVIGAMSGALVAGFIGRSAARPLSAGIVGLAVVGSLVNWTSFTHPIWFIVGQLVLYPAALVAAWGILAKRPPAEAEGR